MAAMDLAGVSIVAAVAAGLVSFLSPCVLPLVPGYLAAVTGVAPNELGEASWKRVLAPSLVFIASFSVIFILLGLTASAIGAALQDIKPTLEKISAVILIVMGVLFLLAPFIPRLNREWHVESLVQKAGRGSPVFAGAAFAVAWTPCIGPTLAGILAVAADGGQLASGAALLAFYSAGLAIPFLLTALLFTRMTTAFGVIKRHFAVIVAVGGAILIAMGILIWTGELFRLNTEAQQLLDSLGLNFFSEV
jgi:cytochrome c-type biogenesis protein